MIMHLVTVRLPKNPFHNPRAKVAGDCPAAPGMTCTDVTGEHHTILVSSTALVELHATYPHITRIEQVHLP